MLKLVYVTFPLLRKVHNDAGSEMSQGSEFQNQESSMEKFIES